LFFVLGALVLGAGGQSVTVAPFLYAGFWICVLVALCVVLFAHRNRLAQTLVPSVFDAEADGSVGTSRRRLKAREAWLTAGISIVAILTLLQAIAAFGWNLRAVFASPDQAMSGRADVVRRGFLADLLIQLVYLAAAVLILRNRQRLTRWMSQRSSGGLLSGWTLAIRFAGVLSAVQAMYAVGRIAAAAASLPPGSLLFTSNMEVIHSIPQAAGWLTASLCLLCFAPSLAAWIGPQRRETPTSDPPRSAGAVFER
jgi:hypothetical protein